MCFILKNKIKAAFIVTLFLIIFFSYGHIYNLINASELDNFEMTIDYTGYKHYYPILNDHWHNMGDTDATTGKTIPTSKLMVP